MYEIVVPPDDRGCCPSTEHDGPTGHDRPTNSKGGETLLTTEQIAARLADAAVREGQGIKRDGRVVFANHDEEIGWNFQTRNE